MKSRYCYCPMTARRIGRRMTVVDLFHRWQGTGSPNRICTRSEVTMIRIIRENKKPLFDLARHSSDQARNRVVIEGLTTITVVSISRENQKRK